MAFADVLHQPAAHDLVQRALANERVPHAYVFTGPEGVGREMFARELAGVLLCEIPKSIPAPRQQAGTRREWLAACGQCVDCRLMASGNHPDYHRIHRGLNKLHPDKKVRDRKGIDLGIDIIRHFVIDQVGHQPARGRAKVFVIAEAERFNIAAQNALLKTLEEPPGRSYLILLATSPDELLPTTNSRCQRVPFKPLPGDFVVQELIDRAKLPADAARFLSHASGGSLGTALWLARAGLHGRVGDLIDLIRKAQSDPLAAGKQLLELSKDVAKEIKAANSTKASPDDELDGTDEESEDADAPREEKVETNTARQSQLTMLALLAAVLGDIQRVVVGGAPIAGIDRRAAAEFAARSSPRAIGAAIRAIGAAEYQIEHSAGTGLVFDGLGIALGRAFETTAMPA